MNNVLILVAMQGEAQPIIDKLALKELGPLLPHYPMRHFSREITPHKQRIDLVVNGCDPKHLVDRVGAHAAAISAFASIEQCAPDAIISIGTAGAVAKEGAEIADIYLANTVFFVDRRIPIPGYYEYGLGYYDSAATTSIAKAYNFKFAHLCTSNSLGLTAEDWRIIKETRCVINDMEAASIAEIAALNKIPFYAIKGVTNLLDKPCKSDSEDFADNFSTVVQKLAEQTPSFIKAHFFNAVSQQ